jgi:hypothetical protein
MCGKKPLTLAGSSCTHVLIPDWLIDFKTHVLALFIPWVLCRSGLATSLTLQPTRRAGTLHWQLLRGSGAAPAAGAYSSPE